MFQCTETDWLCGSCSSLDMFIKRKKDFAYGLESALLLLHSLNIH